jgi:dTDP-4-dehydrorhamnose reductase
LIVPCTSEEYSTAAKRPKNSILENRKLKKEGINLMKKWFNDVDQFICNYREQLLSEALNTKK